MATVVADNHNLFGVNGNAGVVGFTPGPTDIVPPAGVQLSNILNPVLAFNGGPTQTHALVPGSPAIDAGGPVCTDANGNPLLTDQRGKPRIIDGNGDGTARCDIGAFEFFPVVNNLVTLDPDLDTSFNPTPVPGAPAGIFTISATFTNTSGTALRFPFFTVTELSGGNLLLNADEGTQGVGATVTPNVGDQVLSPGETVQVDFVIGLQTSDTVHVLGGFICGAFGLRRFDITTPSKRDDEESSALSASSEPHVKTSFMLRPGSARTGVSHYNRAFSRSPCASSKGSWHRLLIARYSASSWAVMLVNKTVRHLARERAPLGTSEFCRSPKYFSLHGPLYFAAGIVGTGTRSHQEITTGVFDFESALAALRAAFADINIHKSRSVYCWLGIMIDTIPQVIPLEALNDIRD